MSLDAIIIGGGVSGLATAHHLKARGLTVKVLERQVRTGGNAVSERIDGFLMEHGPSSLNVAAPDTMEMSQALGLNDAICPLGDDVVKRYLVADGCMNAISSHPLGFILSDYLSVPARLRLMAEVLLPHRAGDTEETVAEFSNRHFGPEFTERVIEPLVGGLYAGLASQLSTEAVFPKLLEMERTYGSLIVAILVSWLKNRKAPIRRLFSWKNGIGTLPMALADTLSDDIATSVAVKRIRRGASGFVVEALDSQTVSARSVIIATQPHVAAGLLEGIDDAGAACAADIAAPPLAVAFLGYRRDQVDHPLDGLGYLTPPSEGRNLSGALFCTTMFSERAPQGHVALSAYLGGARAPGLALCPPEDIIAMVQEEFKDLLGARGKPVVAQVRQWPQGLPQLTPNHVDRYKILKGISERVPGLYVTGNFLAGPAIASCLTQASSTAARAADFLVHQKQGEGLATYQKK